MKLTGLLEQNQLHLSFEVFPPKTSTLFEDVKQATEQIAALCPSYISVTYGAGGGTSAYTLDIAKNIKALTEMKEVKGIVTNFEAAAEKASRLADTANRIADRVERGEGTVGKLLSSDDTVYNDLKRTLASAADIAERINRGEGTVGKLLSKDDTLHDEIKDSLAAFRKAVSSFDLGDTKGGISNLVANADKLMVNLNAVADKIKKGEGTLGKLTSDPELYDEANALVKDIRQVVDNYRDSTPITTFSSLIMGGL